MDKDDIFKKAAKEVAKSTLKVEVEKPAAPVALESKALAMTNENLISPWAKMKEKLNNGYTEKAMDIMDTLPDREFIKVYLKLMDFVNPKMTRKEIVGNNEGDTEIKVLIVQNQNGPKEKIIDVTGENTPKEKNS